MTRTMRFFAVLLLLAAPFTAFSGGDDSAGDAAQVSAPDFSSQDADGKTVQLKDYRGKVVLLKFWAYWCGPCRYSMPATKKMQEQYGKDGFVVFLVGLGRNKSQDKKWLDDNGYKFPVQLYQGGWKTAPYKVSGIPMAYLIDRQGKIVWQGHGHVPDATLQAALRSGQNSPGAVVPNPGDGSSSGSGGSDPYEQD